MTSQSITSISVHEDIKERLRNLMNKTPEGYSTETFNDVITRLLNEHGSNR